jgi:hypothetical protein
LKPTKIIIVTIIDGKQTKKDVSNISIYHFGLVDIRRNTNLQGIYKIISTLALTKECRN